MAFQPVPYSIDPRLLVTKAEAEAVLGEPIDEAVVEVNQDETGQVLLTICTYVTLSETPVKGVSIGIVQTPAIEDLTRMFQKAKSQADRGVEPAPGLGHEAYWAAGSGQLHLLKDNVWLIISADSAGEFSSIEAARTLALNAISRLHL